MSNSEYPTSAPIVLMLFFSMLIMFGLSILFFTQLGNRMIGEENQTYLIASSCIVSVEPNKRTPDYVKGCYDKAESITNRKVEHFGDSK